MPATSDGAENASLLGTVREPVNPGMISVPESGYISIAYIAWAHLKLWRLISLSSAANAIPRVRVPGELSSLDHGSRG